MELKVFEGQNKNELSMIEVAHAILANKGDVMPFADLANEVQSYLVDSNKEIRDRLPQFYTDLNVDGSFISLGDNLWGLRTWYPYESIDEATVHTDIDEEDRPKKKRRKVNAFLADASDDDDVIDYDDDDPEDDSDDFGADPASDNDDDDSAATSGNEDISKYNNDLKDIGDSDDEDDSDLPDGIEGDLTNLSEDDLLDDDDEDDENDDLGTTPKKSDDKS